MTVDTIDEAELADLPEDAEQDTEDRRRSRRRWRWAWALVPAVVIGGAVFGVDKYHSVTDQLTALQRTQSDRDAAAKLAREYALKSLTYTFEDPDAFFRSVEGGVSQTLKDKYVNATDILKGVMLQAQVTSAGEVLATDALAQPGGVYQVVVSAAQTTRNLQNPKPRVSLILLQVTVNKVGGSWQVSDIGPKTATPGPEAGSEPAPAPAPAPVPRR